MHRRTTRMLACVALAGTLLLTGGTAGAATDTTEHGPCLLDDPVMAMKCAHYKLQEARRLSARAGGACDQWASNIRDDVYLYWAFR